MARRQDETNTLRAKSRATVVYKTKVGAALRPAFSGDTASHVTAAACDVCSAWIGCGVARDINDLRRVHQLLVSSLVKLNTKGNTTLIYNESMATLEKLSILKAWAEVYIVAMVSHGGAPGSYVRQLHARAPSTRAVLTHWSARLSHNKVDNSSYMPEESDDDFGDFESKGESLLRLVAPELDSLGDNWLAALRDHALLSLPPEFSSQLPHGGGAFYLAETGGASRAHYRRAWPALLLAAALRFNKQTASTDSKEDADNKAVKNKTENGNCEFFEPMDERFHLLFGICMEALCAQRDLSSENTINVLQSLVTLLDHADNRARLLKDRALAIEVCQILHRAALTQESVEALLLAADALKLVIIGAKEQLNAKMEAKIKELAPSETPTPPAVLEAIHTLGEGGVTGTLAADSSLAFAGVEAALQLLLRRLPALSPTAQHRSVGVIGERRGLGVHGDTLLIKSLSCLSELPNLTSPQGALSILPTILYLATGVLQWSDGDGDVASAAILLLQAVAETRCVRVHEETARQHSQLLHSTTDKLLTLVKNDEPGQSISALLGARAMAALIPHAAPAPALHYPCINHFRQCLDEPSHEVLTSYTECLNLRAMAALIPHAAPAPALHYPCINHFRQCLDEPSHEVLTSYTECLNLRAMAALIPHAAPAPALHYPCINHFRQCLDEPSHEVLTSYTECLNLRAMAALIPPAAPAPALHYPCINHFRQCLDEPSHECLDEPSHEVLTSYTECLNLRAMAALIPHAAPAPALHYPCINHFRQCLDEPSHEVLTSYTECHNLRAMAALIPHAAPAPALHYPCINHFRQCLDEPSHETFAACCAVVRNIWSSSATPESISWSLLTNKSQPYRVATDKRISTLPLSPHCCLLCCSSQHLVFINYARTFAACCAVVRNIWSSSASPECVSWWARALAPRLIARAAAAKYPVDASHTKAAVAALTALTDLVDVAPDDTARVGMLRLLIPVVASWLRAGAALGAAAGHERSLHHAALAHLTGIAAKYPQEFKTMMQQSGELRLKLEAAVKASQQHSSRQRSAPQRPVFDTRPARPTIELKTDFSDFR
ncbi:unnamed protein product [Plutella xylostella]|uniref:(diamondback moth) hypothetical protein n=1 Tax=Plutella xylostella TaxID=51655 RepID=A0A8S4EBP6_PLUXY|nr:unnamed protein product [Plutella xylostella]